MFSRAAELMATTFCMAGSPVAARAALHYPKLLMSQRFGTSAQKGENGFVRQENCFVSPVPTKHSRRKCEYSQCAERWRCSAPGSGRPMVRAGAEGAILTLPGTRPARHRAQAEKDVHGKGLNRQRR